MTARIPIQLIRRIPARAGDGNDAVTLEDVARCARPIHFETDDEAFLYSGNGTGFFAVMDDDWFLFTPAHVVRAADPRTVCVLPSDGSRRWILINRQVTGQALDSEDTDVVDVRCFQFDTIDLQIPIGEEMRAVNLGHPVAEPRPGDRLLSAGYPGVSREIDYDASVIQAVGRTIEGRYRGRSVAKRCHQIELTELDGIENLDGFSGSPVFVLDDQQEDVATVRLAGMLLRGEAASRRAHYVEAAVLLTFARAARTGSATLMRAES